MKTAKYLFVFGIIITMMACKKTSPNLFYSYNQQAMLTNIGTNVLAPAITGFSTSATAAQTAVDSFISNPTTTTLATAQSSFSQLAISWAAVEPFNFGPLQTNLWAPTINTWPVDTGAIESAVSSQASASTQGAAAKGLKALEYLLYDKNGNTAVLAKYTGGTAAATNRKNYLSSVLGQVVSIASSLQNSWTGSGNYLNGTFIRAQGNNVSSSIGLLINSMAYFTDQMKNLKVGTPIGMGSTVNDGQPHPNLIEYPIAELSLPAMNANLLSMKSVLDGGTGPGFKSMLDSIKAQQNGQNLSTIGDNDFSDAITKLNAVTPPYATATSTETQQLINVFNSYKAIIVYFEVDVASDCGVSITFNDTDGD